MSRLFTSGGQSIGAISFSISPSNEHPGLISFRMDWLDLLAVQETLKSLLQHHSLKASVLRCSAFFIVQLSHPYLSTRKTTALTRWTFVGKVMSLLFNMLSRLVITFLSRSKHLLTERGKKELLEKTHTQISLLGCDSVSTAQSQAVTFDSNSTVCLPVITYVPRDPWLLNPRLFQEGSSGDFHQVFSFTRAILKWLSGSPQCGSTEVTVENEEEWKKFTKLHKSKVL